MEKFHQMKLNSDLGATMLTRSVDIRGSGAYLNEQRSDFTVVHQALYYTLETVHEKLNLSDVSIKDYMDAEQLNNQLATHIVTQITWALTASCPQQRLSGDQDPHHARQALVESFRALEAEQVNEFKAPRGFKGQICRGRREIVEVTVHSDFLPADNSQFRDLESARRYILNLLDGAYQRLQREAVGV